MWFKPASSGVGGAGMWTDRGDVAAFDFDKGDLETDVGTGVLDLSAIVGTGKRMVHIRGSFGSVAGGDRILFRTNGYTNAYNYDKWTCQTAHTLHEHIFHVVTDEDGKVGYSGYIPSGSVQLTVVGWGEAA